MTTEATKRCPDCATEKPLTAFPANRSTRDGRGTYCSSCYAVRYRHHREKKAAREGRTLRPQRDLPDGQAYCPACETVKRLEDFGRNAGARNGRTAYCRPCHNERSKQTAGRLYGGYREYHLRRRYGITGAQYDALVEAQGGRCALCQEREPQHVDHDHLTGEVRGVLCSCCNQGLGSFRDRAQLLRSAADYLERSGWQREARAVRVAPGVHALLARSDG